jgi:hypothetical protein
MKSNQKTFRQRVEEVLSLRLLGALPTDIRRHAQEQGWGVSDRQLQRYTAAADEQLAESVEKNRDKLMAHHFCARRALFARAMAVSDYGTALRVLQDEAALLALYPEKQTARDGGNVQVNVWAPKLERLPDEDLAALARLAEQLHQANGAPTNGTGHEGSTRPASAGADLPGAVSPVLPQLCGPDADPQ